MTNIHVTPDRLAVEMLGWEKFWSLKSRIEVPLSHVREVRAAAADERPRGLRMPGTYIPGMITAGTFARSDEREFWAVHNKLRAVVIELHDDFYSRLVVEVPDPGAAIAAVQEACGPVRA